MTFKDILGEGLKTDLSDRPPVYAGTHDPLVPEDKKESIEKNVVKMILFCKVTKPQLLLSGNITLIEYYLITGQAL